MTAPRRQQPDRHRSRALRGPPARLARHSPSDRALERRQRERSADVVRRRDPDLRRRPDRKDARAAALAALPSRPRLASVLTVAARLYSCISSRGLWPTAGGRGGVVAACRQSTRSWASAMRSSGSGSPIGTTARRRRRGCEVRGGLLFGGGREVVAAEQADGEVGEQHRPERRSRSRCRGWRRRRSPPRARRPRRRGRRCRRTTTSTMRSTPSGACARIARGRVGASSATRWATAVDRASSRRCGARCR